jgi:hypothetical protein
MQEDQKVLRVYSWVMSIEALRDAFYDLLVYQFCLTSTEWTLNLCRKFKFKIARMQVLGFGVLTSAG